MYQCKVVSSLSEDAARSDYSTINIWAVSCERLIPTCTINALKLSDTTWCHRSWLSLLQAMACRLFGAKPLLEPILTYVGPKHNIFVKEKAYKISPAKCQPFCPIWELHNTSTSKLRVVEAQCGYTPARRFISYIILYQEDVGKAEWFPMGFQCHEIRPRTTPGDSNVSEGYLPVCIQHDLYLHLIITTQWIQSTEMIVTIMER